VLSFSLLQRLSILPAFAAGVQGKNNPQRARRQAKWLAFHYRHKKGWDETENQLTVFRQFLYSVWPSFRQF
jgi:hypothetical protein